MTGRAVLNQCIAVLVAYWFDWPILMCMLMKPRTIMHTRHWPTRLT